MNDVYPKAYFYRRIVLAKLYIEEHYFEAFDIDEIANTSYYSKYHFIREFKTVYGLTPMNYVQTQRGEKVMELLKTSMTVTEVCMSVGYSSLSTFSRVFKKKVGLSPSKFQKNHKERERLIMEKAEIFIPSCMMSKVKKGDS